jgi:poly-gamma-glutamate synthesis protein (capsule biosynthesis protein)
MHSRIAICFAGLALLASACTASEAATGSPATTLAPITTLSALSTTTAAAPTPETSTTIAATTTAVPAPIEVPLERLVVNGVGDVNLDPTFVRSFPSTGYEDAWTGLYGAFLRDDLTIVNLECSPSDLGTPWVKAWNFRCDVDALPSMAAAGVDVANLANNHGMDYGFDAMLDGRMNLLDAGILPVGTGASIGEAYTPVIVERKGWTIAVIGSGGVNPESGSWLAREDTPGMTHGDDTESIAEAIQDAKKDADLVFVTAHWGEQGTTRPRAFERGQAEAWIDAGADGVFGHHQHVLQPLEWYHERPIAWGLGNFVWQAYPAESKRTAIAQFVFEPDGRIGACLVPVVIERTGHPVIQNHGAPVCAPPVGGNG